MSFCVDSEGWGPLSNARLYDFTPCFEHLFIESFPKLLLLILGVPRLIGLSSRTTATLPSDYLLYGKLSLHGLLLVLALVKLGTSLYLQEDLSLIVSSCLDIMFFGFASRLTYLEHYRARRSSTALLFFWLSEIVSQALILRTAILMDLYDNQPILFALTLQYLVFGLIIFVLENIRKPRLYYEGLIPPHLETPEHDANIFSRITFHWMDPLMKLGYKKVLNMSDLWNLKLEDKAEYNSEKFQEAWFDETLFRSKRPSLLWATTKTYGLFFASAAIFKATQDILAFLQPQLLKAMMEFAKSWSPDKGNKDPVGKGFLIAFAMLFAAACQTTMIHQYFHICLVTGMRLRSAIITAIYRKSLKLSNQSRQIASVGEIVNMMSVDAQRLADLCTYLHILWSGPFQMSMAIYFLYQSLGPAVFGGVAVMVLMIPINAVLASKSRKLNKIQMNNKDSRSRLMDELLSGIRVIKLYAWEPAFLRKIHNVREAELKTLEKIGYLSAFQTFTWCCTPFLVSFTTFAIYSLTSTEPLTSTKIFVSISLFNLLQFPLSVFPSVITAVVEASVSFNRIYKFLLSEELDTKAVRFDPVLPFQQIGKVERVNIKDGSFKWTPESVEVLQDINLSVEDGSLLAIVGAVGSGKSSLISSILGEMTKSKGEVIVRGTIAYVPQTAWIMNATLRENILFGRRYDHKHYKDTLSACGLVPDLEQLPAGDMTEIGERGINLSGGQRQRISLARAVYSRAEIYLFDDSLSAVDAHVGKHIFDKVIGPKGLLHTKARIFATNAIQFLPLVNYILTLNAGSISEAGTYKQLMDCKGQLYNLLSDYHKQEDRRSRANSVASKSRTTSEGSTGIVSPKLSGSTQEPQPTAGASLMTEEDTAKGSVSWSVYKAYAASCSYRSVFIFLALAVTSQLLSVAQNLYLADWASFNDSLEHLPGVDPNITIWLGTYASIGLTYSVAVVCQVVFVWVYCGIKSARVLHNNMLDNVVHLPQRFFDTTPLGRVLNRFSKDQYTVDEILPRSFNAFFRTLFNVVTVLAINAYGSPYYLVLAVPLSVLYMYFQRFYLSTSRELKRLDSTSKSPIFAHFQETLSGVSTIRAYKSENRFITANEARVDFNQKAYYPSISSNRWLAVRLEFIGALVVFSSALFSVFNIIFGLLPASIIGLMLTYSLSITNTLNWLVRQSCEIETNIVSVERIHEYSNLQREAAYHIENATDIQGWPDQGIIEFHDYSTRYREGLDLVLKDVDFAIKTREKIGIVGRTGAGKSSLTFALFRLIEAALGEIRIDGINISKLGLGDLRSRLTIIPQDPVLFAGTVRDNLDPFHVKTDADLWDALDAASLKDFVRSLPGGLSSIIHQGGENFSVGQRQLICLARAILRKTKILILDEATAAIDVETDVIIQRTIREKFCDSTVLTIAHRINTVLDNDRILVLSRGRVIEFDSPQNLLKNNASVFYSLAREAGLVNAGTTSSSLATKPPLDSKPKK